MNVRELELPLSGFGARPTQAHIQVGTLSPAERLRRAAAAPALGLGIALLVLPIPIVHFAVPPLALTGGIAFGIRRALQREIFRSAHGACPFCGMDQTLGLTGAVFRLPQDLKCRSCLKLLLLDAA
jgi:hypothetical protein